MHTRRRKEDVLSQFRRSELVESARRVFGSHGFEHATMDAIAKDAEVAKGTIYLSYSSKQEIYDAAFLASMTELEEATRKTVEAAGTVQEAIAAFVVTRASFFQARQDFFRMYIDEIGRRVAAPRSRRSPCGAQLERQTRILEDVMRRAVARGELREVDPAAAALAIFDMTRGLVARHLASREPQDIPRDVAFLTELIWTGLKPARRKAQ